MPSNITRIITAVKYQIKSLIHPTLSIFAIISKNLNAELNLLSLFVMCAIENANMGAMMKGYNRDIETIDDSGYTPNPRINNKNTGIL